MEKGKCYIHTDYCDSGKTEEILRNVGRIVSNGLAKAAQKKQKEKKQEDVS